MGDPEKLTGIFGGQDHLIGVDFDKKNLVASPWWLNTSNRSFCCKPVQKRSHRGDPWSKNDPFWIPEGELGRT